MILPSHRLGVPWTAPEDAVIAKNYPGNGARACAPLLPGRTIKAIQRRAGILGHAVGNHPNKRRTADQIEKMLATKAESVDLGPAPLNLDHEANRLHRLLGRVVKDTRMTVWLDSDGQVQCSMQWNDDGLLDPDGELVGTYQPGAGRGQIREDLAETLRGMAR